MKKYNDYIHVEGVHPQVRLNTRRVHVRAVPVLLKMCTTHILLCVHPVSVLLKIYDSVTMHQQFSRLRCVHRLGMPP